MIATTPLVSVCIPAYNCEATIAAAIDSVFAQTLADFELVVVDDGSRDRTREIVESYSDPRLRYFRNSQNLGPEGNWNRCLEEARGKYFKLLPHDDLLAPRCLEQQTAVLEQDAGAEVALVFCARDVIGPNGRVLARRGFPGSRGGVLSPQRVIAACVRHGTNVLGEPASLLFRKSLADQVGRFDASNPYVVDLDYWFRLLQRGSAYYLPDALASFRVWPQSWSVAIGGNQASEFRHFIRRVAWQVDGTTSSIDRLLGFVTPTLNNIARLAFYAIYLREKT